MVKIKNAMTVIPAMQAAEKIRLTWIVAPELMGTRADQESAHAERNHLRALVIGENVGIRRIGNDR